MSTPDGMIRVLEIHEKNKETGMVEVRVAFPDPRKKGGMETTGVIRRYLPGAVAYIGCYPIIPKEKVSKYEKHLVAGMVSWLDYIEWMNEGVGHA